MGTLSSPVDVDRTLVLLRRQDGSEVGSFGATEIEEAEKKAFEDARQGRRKRPR